MKKILLIYTYGILTLLAVMMIRSPAFAAGTETANWWEAKKEVASRLAASGADLVLLTKQVKRITPKNIQETMFRLCVFMRAGMGKEAVGALHDLKRICPTLDDHEVLGIYYDASEEQHAWDVAQAVIEIFAENISSKHLEYSLLRHFMESGWSVDQVDQWLAAKPKGNNNFWVKARLRFQRAHGRGDALEKELADQVRANPENIAEAITFLDALIYARTYEQKPADLTWIGETVKPISALDASEIAERLTNLNQWKLSVLFYHRAIAIPLTRKEVERLHLSFQALMADDVLRAGFAVHLREGLSECLLKMGESAEAQKWMLAAAEIRKKNRLGRNPFLAGQVQAGSGQYVIEGEIKAEEKFSGDDPRYWEERARYYRGRKEAGLEEEALKQGLELALKGENLPPPEGKSALREEKRDDWWRSRFTTDYASFLKRQNREEEAIALLRRELKNLPPASEASGCVANLLAFDFNKRIIVDDPLLWNWLQDRPVWDFVETRLLWEMLLKANRSDLDKYFSRAEKLASRHNPSRGLALGWIENRMGFPQRSIPLLEYAAAKTRDKELKNRANFTLLESFLDMGDWKRSEAIFPQAVKQLTAGEIPYWQSRIAVAAAKAGAKSDAMRIWRRMAGNNPSVTNGLDQLAKAGLRSELIAFYLDMQKKMPTSDISPKVLKMLRAE